MSTSNGPETEQQDASAGSDSVATGRRLLQSTSVVSGMTLLSRVLGLVRDMVFRSLFRGFDRHGRVPGSESNPEHAQAFLCRRRVLARLRARHGAIPGESTATMRRVNSSMRWPEPLPLFCLW